MRIQMPVTMLLSSLNSELVQLVVISESVHGLLDMTGRLIIKSSSVELPLWGQLSCEGAATPMGSREQIKSSAARIGDTGVGRGASLTLLAALPLTRNSTMCLTDSKTAWAAENSTHRRRRQSQTSSFEKYVGNMKII
ncbi:uncharacterized protein LOC110834381 isoform X2 [Zootermopsis nevadensis]|uniref:uncharacterized protein LOC110834381 isoform X2 n=1 Tax=Zootermopsis nevadensis TaxID=136037 RepID=UPI000B8E258C|nr:uncharacterized protein LOC110834381 isoform X2 [Zootermopsis nevadensis]